MGDLNLLSLVTFLPLIGAALLVVAAEPGPAGEEATAGAGETAPPVAGESEGELPGRAG